MIINIIELILFGAFIVSLIFYGATPASDEETLLKRSRISAALLFIFTTVFGVAWIAEIAFTIGVVGVYFAIMATIVLTSFLGVPIYLIMIFKAPVKKKSHKILKKMFFVGMAAFGVLTFFILKQMFVIYDVDISKIPERNKIETI